MNSNILLECKKSPCFAPVKTVLGPLSPRKISPSPNPNPNANPNSNAKPGSIFLGDYCPDIGKNKRNEKQNRNQK